MANKFTALSLKSLRPGVNNHMAKKFTALTLKALRPGVKRAPMPVDGRGLYLHTGETVLSWEQRGRLKSGKDKGKTFKVRLGHAGYFPAGSSPPDGYLTLQGALAAAAAVRDKNERGEDPRPARAVAAPSPETLAAVCIACFTRGSKHGLRSATRQLRDLERLVFPSIGTMSIATVRRGTVIRLLDRIEDEQGPAAADNVLAAIGKAMRWYAVRDENYAMPLVPGMRRYKAKERARDRILSDPELRAVWGAAEASPDTFARLVQFLLLVGCRKGEAIGMRRGEVVDGVWLCPAERSKSKKQIERPLSKAAQTVLAQTPHILDEFVFTTNGLKPYSAIVRDKKIFDAACGVSGYTIHDLRRTSRSLLSRAGVLENVAERCLAHVIPGVKGVYDRHRYQREMLDAYERLATLIDHIAHPQANVTPLRA
jgi:integrase